MKLKKNDEVVRAFLTYAHEEVIVVSKDGFATCYSSDQIPSTNCKSQGVKAIKLANGDNVAAACCLKKENNAIVLINSLGMAKRIKDENITRTSRSVKGERLCKYVKSNPSQIIDVRSVSTYDKITYVSDKYINIEAKDVTIMSKESTFSNVVEVNANFYILKDLQECKIIDRPQNDELMQDQSDKLIGDYEMLDLFDENNE